MDSPLSFTEDCNVSSHLPRDQDISITSLEDIQKFGVKFKFIHRGKKIIDYTNQYYYNLFRDMYDAVKVTRLRDVKLVWVDEAMFTFNTFSTRAWSAKNKSI